MIKYCLFPLFLTTFISYCPFDISMLNYELKRIGYETKFPFPPEQMCTVELSRPLLQTDDAPRSLRLIDLYHHAFEEKRKEGGSICT